MKEVPNSLIFAIGMLDSSCKQAEMAYEIVKYPEQNKYEICLFGDKGCYTLEADYIDDLIKKAVEFNEGIQPA